METSLFKSDRNSLVLFLEENRSFFADTAHTFTSMFAEDCVQEAMLNALDKIDSFKGKSAEQLVAWVRRIVINKCLSKLRLKANHQQVGISNVDVFAASQSSPSKHLRLDEELKKLNDAMEELSERERDAATYHYLLGLSVQDTADVMGETKGAVQGLLFRGLKKLGNLLRESQFSVMLKK